MHVQLTVRPNHKLCVLPIASFSATSDLLLPAVERIRAKPFFDTQLVRQPLMVEPRRIGRFGDVHAIIDAIHHHLQHCSDDPAPPGLPVTSQVYRLSPQSLVTLTTADVYSARRRWHHRPPPVNVRHARFSGEIIHLIIKQNTALARDNTRTEGGVQRIGHRHRVTVFIHH